MTAILLNKFFVLPAATLFIGNMNVASVIHNWFLFCYFYLFSCVIFICGCVLALFIRCLASRCTKLVLAKTHVCGSIV